MRLDWRRAVGHSSLFCKFLRPGPRIGDLSFSFAWRESRSSILILGCQVHEGRTSFAFAFQFNNMSLQRKNGLLCLIFRILSLSSCNEMSVRDMIVLWTSVFSNEITELCEKFYVKLLVHGRYNGGLNVPPVGIETGLDLMSRRAIMN